MNEPVDVTWVLLCYLYRQLFEANVDSVRFDTLAQEQNLDVQAISDAADELKHQELVERQFAGRQAQITSAGIRYVENQATQDEHLVALIRNQRAVRDRIGQLLVPRYADAIKTARMQGQSVALFAGYTLPEMLSEFAASNGSTVRVNLNVMKYDGFVVARLGLISLTDDGYHYYNSTE